MGVIAWIVLGLLASTLISGRRSQGLITCPTGSPAGLPLARPGEQVVLLRARPRPKRPCPGWSAWSPGRGGQALRRPPPHAAVTGSALVAPR
jgi:hypothetical protein